MINICTKCFSEIEIQAFIESESKTKGRCSCCGKVNVSLLNIEELKDFFQELLDNFQVSLEGYNLTQLINSNWKLFRNDKSASFILNHLLPKLDTEIRDSHTAVDFTQDILENFNYWEVLKHQLKYERRFITDIETLIDDYGWDSFFGSKIMLTKDCRYYRARLHQKESESPLDRKDMSCPPRHLSTAGRANPQGIPFLYLSESPETVLYETRATYLDEISIGTFSIKDEIKGEISISDFTEVSTIFHPNNIKEKIKIKLLKDAISKDLSKPLRRYDSELDYIPTQFICEFIKIYTGVNGIKFKSSLHDKGINLVIFDENIMECNSVSKMKVHKVAIEAE